MSESIAACADIDQRGRDHHLPHRRQIGRRNEIQLHQHAHRTGTGMQLDRQIHQLQRHAPPKSRIPNDRNGENWPTSPTMANRIPAPLPKLAAGTAASRMASDNLKPERSLDRMTRLVRRDPCRRHVTAVVHVRAQLQDPATYIVVVAQVARDLRDLHVVQPGPVQDLARHRIATHPRRDRRRRAARIDLHPQLSDECNAHAGTITHGNRLSSTSIMNDLCPLHRQSTTNRFPLQGNCPSPCVGAGTPLHYRCLRDAPGTSRRWQLLCPAGPLMGTGRSTETSRELAEERVVRTFLERAASVILESRTLDGQRFDAVLALAKEVGLTREQLSCELRFLELRGVITSAPWDRLDTPDDVARSVGSAGGSRDRLVDGRPAGATLPPPPAAPEVAGAVSRGGPAARDAVRCADAQGAAEAGSGRSGLGADPGTDRHGAVRDGRTPAADRRRGGGPRGGRHRPAGTTSAGGVVSAVGQTEAGRLSVRRPGGRG